MDVHHVPLWFVLMALGAQLFISGAAAKFRALHDLDGFAAHDDAASTTRGNAASATWEASDGVKPVQYKHDSPPSPPRPRSSQQPDEVQKDSPFVSEELKCGERIPPESILTSTVGGSENSITTFAKSLYKGPSEGGRHHRWNYAVEFTNKGPSPVQLLTRHLIFSDERGKAEEIKGPGARGAMPVIMPGSKWEYTSGARLETPRGSMHGWFTFEDVVAGRLFSIRVGRLALSPENKAELVPCPSTADVGKLPPTSVHSTERVIVGAVATHETVSAEAGIYRFTIDLQVNNARDTPVIIIGHKWDLVDSKGQQQVHREYFGTAGSAWKAVVNMPPSSVMRIKCEMPHLYSSSAIVSGALLARMVSQDTSEGSEKSPLPEWADGEEEEEEEEGEVIEVVVAPLGASADGMPVPHYRPLGFLAALTSSHAEE